ncbi:hypothetical protein BDY19DRAFT_911724 [Irpex rosettiformis]|uniref:Uncharacterized protein n=1 Tax=Irpex rosettiformis TaxID=378272 RepID=A0ACB8UIK5_9APHY|nr:hypothetical protein BDY19DRAFT_911724 [Irpex rosettiformis]
MARAYSSDVLRLDYLSRDGEVVLRLLREVVPQDISVTPKEPHWIRCQEWDVESQRVERDAEMTEEEKGDLLEVLVLRTKLIYLVLEGIIDSFFGRPLPQVTVSKERDRRPKEAKVDELRKTKEEYRLLYGGAGQAKLREELAALEERKSRREVTCGNCERVQEEGERFMRCKKCWDSLQRNVTYCGKDCQTADWKSRHKGICGKPLSSLNSVLAATRPRQSPFQSPQTSQFPPPTNGFQRTPQLVMHIRLLDTEPEFDYILHVGLSDPAKISIPQGPVRELFRAARFKAFVEGDREAYTQMSHFLIWFVRARLDDVKRRWDLKNAVTVMKTEFAFPELRMEMRKCQDVQWRDESRRP